FGTRKPDVGEVLEREPASEQGHSGAELHADLCLKPALGEGSVREVLADGMHGEIDVVDPVAAERPPLAHVPPCVHHRMDDDATWIGCECILEDSKRRSQSGADGSLAATRRKNVEETVGAVEQDIAATHPCARPEGRLEAVSCGDARD